MATVTFKVHLKDTAKDSGLYAVRIRITRFRKHAYYNTGLAVKKGEFNEAGSEKLSNWIKGHRQHRTYNENLQTAIDEIRELAGKHPHYTAKELHQHYKAKEPEAAPDTPQKGLLSFWQVWIDRKRALGQEGTAVNYESTRSYLLKFAGPAPDEQRILTPTFAAEFVAWLRNPDQEKKKKAFAASTCREALRQLNTVYRQGVLEGWVPQAGNPFEVALHVEKKKRERPAFSVVQAMTALPLAPGTVEHDARLCFLLQFYLHGARVSEALELEWAQVQESRVRYRPKKRATRLKSVAMNPGIRWVLERCAKDRRYVLPYLPCKLDSLSPQLRLKQVKAATDQVRYGLQKIATMLGTEHRLTSHMARHTFADKALSELDDMRVLQEMLGHASMRTTEHYVADLKEDLLDDASSAVYGVFPEENNRETIEPKPAETGKVRKGRKRNILNKNLI